METRGVAYAVPSSHVNAVYSDMLVRKSERHIIIGNVVHRINLKKMAFEINSDLKKRAFEINSDLKKRAFEINSAHCIPDN